MSRASGLFTRRKVTIPPKRLFQDVLKHDSHGLGCRFFQGRKIDAGSYGIIRMAFPVRFLLIQHNAAGIVNGIGLA